LDYSTKTETIQIPMDLTRAYSFVLCLGVKGSVSLLPVVIELKVDATMLTTLAI
jgi:hypothetical protein